MATIRSLCSSGFLVPIEITLGRFDFSARNLYASPECRNWFDRELRQLTAVDSGNLPPRHQFFMLLKDFITGKSFDHPRDFRRLRPVTEDVYELKTPDIRIFGWFPGRDVFIAVTACGLEDVKTRNPDDLRADPYLPYINLVIEYRNNLDLDHPKYQKGADYCDILSI